MTDPVAQRISIPNRWLANLRETDRQAAEAMEALFRAATSRNGTEFNVGDRFYSADIGGRDANTARFLVDYPIRYEASNGNYIEDDATTPYRVYRGARFMRVVGVEFGAANNLFEWVGPKLSDVDLCSTANAFYYLADVSGALVEGGSGSTGINWSDTEDPAVAGSTATITHSDDGTTGGTTPATDITVSMSYTLTVIGPFSASPPTPPAAPSANLILTRNYNGGGAVTVATPNPTGTSSVIEGPYPGTYAWMQSITYSDTYTDSTGLTQDRVFILELDVLTGVDATGTITVSILTVASNQTA